MSLPKKHREETENLIRIRSSSELGLISIANWLLNEGYYPEPFIVPPIFRVQGFSLDSKARQSFFYINKTSKKGNKPQKQTTKLQDFQLATLSYPKTGLIERVFGLIHPLRYHDIVFWLKNDWSKVLDKIFDVENEIYSYSFPIPVSSTSDDGISELRSGRMIYEFLEMAEKDLVAESYKFKTLAKIDITNFYNSIYTHTIHWAWLGSRKEAGNAKNCDDLGGKLDKLFQYSNDRRTNGIAVGPALSDLIIEIILSERDKEISKIIKAKKIDFVATRFKDDYRFLCHSEEDADKIIKIVISVLNEFNLQVNESKTKKLPLPDGLYRKHNILYQPYSIRNSPYNEFGKKIPFRVFENTYFKALEIHREYPGTSLLEKFMGELIDKKKTNGTELEIWERLKIEFVGSNIPEEKKLGIIKTNIKKTVSLLIHLTKESPKTLAKVLSILECIILNSEYGWLNENDYIANLIKGELLHSVKNNSAFEFCWWGYFGLKHRYISNIPDLIKMEADIIKESYISLETNPFVKTLLGLIADPFNLIEHSEILVKPISDCGHLVDYLEIFHRNESEIET
jgi:hypothetical protein